MKIKEISASAQHTLAKTLAVTSLVTYSVVGNQTGMFLGKIITDWPHERSLFEPPDTIERAVSLFVIACFALSGLPLGLIVGNKVNLYFRQKIQEFRIAEQPVPNLAIASEPEDN